MADQKVEHDSRDSVPEDENRTSVANPRRIRL